MFSLPNEAAMCLAL
nr:hypothetical protein [Vibrio cholerae]